MLVPFSDESRFAYMQDYTDVLVFGLSNMSVCITRIMETIRQQDGVKYVAHNRVSENNFPVTTVVVLFHPSIGCTSCSN